jgi:hypothetical protein
MAIRLTLAEEPTMEPGDGPAAEQSTGNGTAKESEFTSNGAIPDPEQGAETTPPAPDPKRPKYGRRQAPANTTTLPPKLSCGTASGRGFFVAHPDPDKRPVVMLVKPDGKDTDEEDWFLVDADVEEDLADVGLMYELVLCRTSNGGYFLWRLKVEELGGRIDGYNETAREAFEENAGKRWIKLKGDRKSRAYEAIKGGPITTAIRWPEFEIDELVRRAFRNRVVHSEDHALIRRLRGDI